MLTCHPFIGWDKVRLYTSTGVKPPNLLKWPWRVKVDNPVDKDVRDTKLSLPFQISIKRAVAIFSLEMKEVQYQWFDLDFTFFFKLGFIIYNFNFTLDFCTQISVIFFFSHKFGTTISNFLSSCGIIRFNASQFIFLKDELPSYSYTSYKRGYDITRWLYIYITLSSLLVGFLFL